jgi:uncharacterized membrane protein YeaQ/YmgE (transglycosylase-associated protein family)
VLVNILLWAVFGLLAGAVAMFIGKQPERGNPVGIVVTILLGIAGAILGGWLSSALFNWDVNSFSIQGFAVAVVGALLLLFLYRLALGARKSL